MSELWTVWCLCSASVMAQWMLDLELYRFNYNSCSPKRQVLQQSYKSTSWNNESQTRRWSKVECPTSIHLKMFVIRTASLSGTYNRTIMRRKNSAGTYSYYRLLKCFSSHSFVCFQQICWALQLMWITGYNCSFGKGNPKILYHSKMFPILE